MIFFVISSVWDYLIVNLSLIIKLSLGLDLFCREVLFDTIELGFGTA